MELRNQKRLFIAINGYGVSDNIFTDLSYQAYLIQIFNHLWANYRTKPLIIIPCGGNTDMEKPFKRTEAGEMSKWLKDQMKKVGLAKLWKVYPCATQLSALENMLACKQLVNKNKLIYFCEKTREQKMKELAKKIFGSQAKIIAIEFDGSPTRYDLITRHNLEKEDLQYSLLALKDPRWRAWLKKATKEKIKTLRQLPARLRYQQVDKITKKVKKEWYLRYLNFKF